MGFLRQKIQSLFPEQLHSNPKIIVVDGQNEPEKFGLGSNRQDVRAYIAPWGKYLVINSNVHDVNLLAHEYFHIEIAERLGYLVFKTKLPVWLDEGLALQVDYREKYRFNNQPIDSQEFTRIKTIKRSEFFTASNEQVNKNMRAANAAVYEILDQHSSGLLYKLFSRVRKGEDISDVFDMKNAILSK